MSDKVKPGFYRDAQGNLCKDRRNDSTRRRERRTGDHGERRTLLRRKSDRDTLDQTEAKEMIRDALDDFESEHDDT